MVRWDRTAVKVLPKCSRPVVSLQLMLFVVSVSKYKFPLKSYFTAFSVYFINTKIDLLSDTPGSRNTLGLVSAL